MKGTTSATHLSCLRCPIRTICGKFRGLPTSTAFNLRLFAGDPLVLAYHFSGWSGPMSAIEVADNRET